MSGLMGLPSSTGIGAQWCLDKEETYTEILEAWVGSLR